MKPKTTASINLRNLERQRNKIISEKEIEELKEAFNLLDIDGSGCINSEEMRKAMDSLGLEMRKPYVYAMLAGLEKEATFEEFVGRVKGQLEFKDEREKVERAFEMFDEDNSQSINLSDLTKMAKDLGENVSKEELREIILKIAKNKESITKEEFCNIVMNKELNKNT
eukprot:TRINITY_DN7959_c0_g4_i1.p1 TRINITY_DN7959_c0_g4~~TRINITY_DN7959_c0_g4_i1.p1  ORF type:complete len:168 (-),score=76.31 TRINITY_DN7959_c0_g4_i1:34-537(-)